MLFHKTAHQIAIVFLGSVLFDKLKLYVSHSKKHWVTSIRVGAAQALKKGYKKFYFFQLFNNNLTVKSSVTQTGKKKVDIKTQKKSRFNW